MLYILIYTSAQIKVWAKILLDTQMMAGLQKSSFKNMFWTDIINKKMDTTKNGLFHFLSVMDGQILKNQYTLERMILTQKCPGIVESFPC